MSSHPFGTGNYQPVNYLYHILFAKANKKSAMSAYHFRTHNFNDRHIYKKVFFHFIWDKMPLYTAVTYIGGVL